MMILINESETDWASGRVHYLEEDPYITSKDNFMVTESIVFRSIKVSDARLACLMKKKETS